MPTIAENIVEIAQGDAMIALGRSQEALRSGQNGALISNGVVFMYDFDDRSALLVQGEEIIKAFDTNTEMYTYHQELEAAANAVMEAAASKRKSRRKPKGE